LGKTVVIVAISNADVLPRVICVSVMGWRNLVQQLWVLWISGTADATNGNEP